MRGLIPLFLISGALLLMRGSNLPRGIRNNNPGNLRITNIAWNNKVPVTQNTDGDFEQFLTPQDGIRALYIDLRSKIKRGLNTIEKILPVYAPASENPTENYINSVAFFSGISRDRVLSESDIPLLVPAFIRVENANYVYPQDVLNKAYAMV